MSEKILRDKRGVRYGKITTDLRGDATIYNEHNVRLGTISADITGKQNAHDSHNVRLATYDPKLNVTKDKLGRTIGKGDLLLSLFFN